MVEGRLDLLFIATKIPYLGQVLKGITATADVIDGSDDFWNWLVETFGGDEDDKININVDYHIDLFATGELKVESKASIYHTIEFKGEYKFGIDSEISTKLEVKKITSEAVIGGQAFAKFTTDFTADEIQTKYDGLYAVVYANIAFDDERKSGASKNSQKTNPKDKFKIHDVFAYIKEAKVA